MPTLDVTEVLDSLEFQDLVSVVRRSEVVNDSGVSVLTPTVTPNVSMVVTTASPTDLGLEAEHSSMAKTIFVATRFRLRGPASGFQPDLILYQGSYFKVLQVDDYSRYGAGFVEAVAQSINYTDPPPAG